jgi:hypothetical protein
MIFFIVSNLTKSQSLTANAGTVKERICDPSSCLNRPVDILVKYRYLLQSNILSKVFLEDSVKNLSFGIDMFSAEWFFNFKSQESLQRNRRILC